MKEVSKMDCGVMLVPNEEYVVNLSPIVKEVTVIFREEDGPLKITEEDCRVDTGYWGPHGSSH